MATQIKVEVIKREIIKPSSPTPHHLRSFKLSLIDQVAPFFKTLIILFYPNTNITIEERSNILKISLSETLTEFYPFAGRLRDNLWIDCGDAGAELVLARVLSPASEFLESPDSEPLLGLLVPACIEASRGSVLASPLLLVRASFFDCGAASVSVRLSHKVGDGVSVSIFLDRWSAKAASMSNVGPGFSPRFASSFLFPARESLASAFAEPPFHEAVRVKRLVVPGEKIEALKSKLASACPSVPNPTRVELVLALVWRALIRAGLTSDSVLIQHVNLRRLTVRSTPRSYVGNMASIYRLNGDPGAPAGPRDLVVLLRKGFEEFESNCEARVRTDGVSGLIKELAELRKPDDAAIKTAFTASSLCRLRFYELDFGFGKPSLVCIPNLTLKNRIFLMDNKDGRGVDVWLSLSKEDMALFNRNGRDQLLMGFDSFIPSAM